MSLERPVVCLMGPTATGKTELAVGLVRRFPFDIVSVDSTLVYRGMDIGTAKPDAATLEQAPHRLIDILDPEEAYSAGTFARDAEREIDAIHAAGRVPLLVGGTMLYFRSLTRGLAELPEADTAVRAAIDREAERAGWPALHAELGSIDPETAERVGPNDRQRIQRALEVYRISGRTLTAWQAAGSTPRADYSFIKLALVPGSRAPLHERIGRRFHAMLAAGFVDEVRSLMQREGLGPDSPSMRAVGYRQLWAYLAGRYDRHEAVRRGQAATRQLAKRQLTWLRSEDSLASFDPLEAGIADAISVFLEAKLTE